MFEIFPKMVSVTPFKAVKKKLRISQRTFHAILAMQIRFCLGTIQTFNEH